jgi:hypothetical protein
MPKTNSINVPFHSKKVKAKTGLTLTFDTIKQRKRLNYITYHLLLLQIPHQRHCRLFC